MYFKFSKIAWALIEPLNLCTLLLVVACVLIWRNRTKAGKYLLTIVVGFLCIVTVLPVGDALLIPLEQRFYPGRTPPDKVDGIILLGRAQMPLLTKFYGQPAINDAGERENTFLALARAYPHAKLVFSG